MEFADCCGAVGFLIGEGDFEHIFDSHEQFDEIQAHDTFSCPLFESRNRVSVSTPRRTPAFYAGLQANTIVPCPPPHLNPGSYPRKPRTFPK